ncbi:MAG: PepSY domain-containing protein [Firmicutes bacterium]|nr:PepSY domain-containing protein [Bacillota bacterium]
MNNIMPKKALIAVLCVVAVLGIFVLLAISAGDGETIGEAEAKNAALSHADVSEEDAVFSKVERETEDGKIKYEIDFSAGGYKYDYEVDGRNGAILKSEKELENKTEVAGNDEEEISAIDEETAKRAALNHAGISEEDARFTNVEIDDDGHYYEVNFTANGKMYEYEVDIVRGTVIKAESEEMQQ